VEAPTTPECSYQKKVGPPVAVPVLTLPDPEKTRAVVQSVA
jgi:DNA topoisomerase-1